MLKMGSQHLFATLCVSLLLTTAASAKSIPASAYTEPTIGMEFVAIPGGAFTMGTNEQHTAQPVHTVTVKPFLIGRYEVTFEQYAKFCSSTGRPIPADMGWGTGNRPVINVTWNEAVAFTEWLSIKSGKRMRLPTESEWEYAARAGASTHFPWGNEIGTDNANCKGCSSKEDVRMTVPVGSYAPNDFGLYDVVGNVYEWCLDAQHTTYEGAPIDGSAWLIGGDENQRISRSGSWLQPPVEAQLATRCWETMDRVSEELGFRVLMEQ